MLFVGIKGLAKTAKTAYANNKAEITRIKEDQSKAAKVRAEESKKAIHV